MNETSPNSSGPAADRPLHLHLISMHTSPVAQPGQGDAGGMNVYIDRSLRAILAHHRHISVEVFTLSTAPVKAAVQQLSERAVLHTLYLPQAEGASKAQLPRFIDDFAHAVSRAARRRPDVVHSHYWLSGAVALAYAPEVPLVHTMHTTAAAKDAAAGEGEPREPALRRETEREIASRAAALVVNTEIEAEQMRVFYSAAPEKLHVIAPGVDTGVFSPSPSQPALHAGSATSAHVVFAGRPQPLKGPHLLVEALALLPEDLRVDLEIIGRSGTDYEDRLLDRAGQLGVSDRVVLREPAPPAALAQAFRRADIVACPSSSETFGLVALEAQACGVPVLASDVDGLRTAVADEESGLLVSPRTPQTWAAAMERMIRDPQLRQRLGAQGRTRALSMRWTDTAAALVHTYELVRDRTSRVPASDLQ
ncbi:glycosyltransferase [Rothia sp. LK2588]|uniref:glycosyltransferase n=1 Tax=Rothia sp. LK2588 TaxID=3114369 RepID=UPI0034CD368E